MKRLATIAIVLFFVLIPSAQAQTATPTPRPIDYCYEFDFTVSNGNWQTYTIVGTNPGTWVSGSGWTYTEHTASGFKYRAILIEYPTSRFSSGYQQNIKKVTVTWSRVNGVNEGASLTSNSPARFYASSTGGDMFNWAWGSSEAADVTNGAVSYTSTAVNNGHQGTGNYRFQTFASTDSVATLTASGSVTIHKLKFEGYGVSPFPTSNCGSFAPTATPTPTSTSTPTSTPTPTITPTPLPSSYIKPLATVDTGPWGMVNHQVADTVEMNPPQENTILAFSNEQGAFVHAGAEGIVTSVTKMKTGDCDHYIDYYGVSPLFGLCSFILSDDVTGSGSHHYSIANGILPILETNLYEVVIDVLDNEDSLHYIVEGAPNFVEEGQTVSEGCYVGRTLEMTGFGIQLGSNPDIGFTTSPYGVTIMTVERPDGTIYDGLPLLTEEPPESAPCNQAENFEGCMGDTMLADESSWQVNKAEFFPGGGVVVEAGGYISTLMNLDSELLPEMIAYVRGVNLNDFTMQLGQTIQPTSIFTFGYEGYDGSFSDYTIEADEHLPDSGGMYTVKITNLSPLYPIEISYICVRHTNGEDLDPPSGETGTCSFLNHNFYEGTSNWTGGEAVSGGAAVDDGETISQNVSLTDGTYYLSGILFLNFVGYSPSPSDTTKTLLIEYRFPSGGSYEEALNYTAAQIAQKKNQLQFKVPFTVSSTTSSSFSVKVSLSGFDSALVYGVVFKSLCVFPTSQEGPLVESCTPIAEPSGDDFGSWTRWVWSQHNQFYMCTLMVVLNNMYNTLVNTFKLAGWVQRYSMAVTQNAMNWTAYQAMPWLGGYLANIQPQATSIGGCNTLWCFGEAIVNGISSIFTRLLSSIDLLINQILAPILNMLLWLIRLTFTLLYNIIVAIIELFLLLLQLIIEFFMFAKDLLFSLIGAWNTATPQALPGLWDCTDTVNVHPVCWILWMLENTLFAGASGSAIIPVAVSLGYIVFGIHAVKRVLKLIREVGNGV